MKHLSFSLLITLVFIFTVSFKKASHEFYFSVMTMEKNDSNKSLEVEYRIFSDDLEKALGETDDYKLRLGDKNEVEEADSLIFEYLFNKVSISGDGCKNIDFNYIGKNVDNDLTYVYVEYTNFSSWGKVEIKNQILIDLFDGQENQISFIHDEQVISSACYFENPAVIVDLNP